MTDKKTSYLNLPLPDAGNALAEDCPRLAEALISLDEHVRSADARLDGVEASVRDMHEANSTAVHTTGDETVSGVKTFSGGLVFKRQVFTPTTPIEAGETITISTYVVGYNMVSVFINGVRCTVGDTFSEVGTAGDASTTITINDDISSDYDVQVVVG